jgi:hypothetical protein
LPPGQRRGRLMEGVLSFVQSHKPYFEVAQAFSSVVNLFAWLVALLLLVLALRKNRIESLSVGPFSFRMMKEEAIVATATASRAWQSTSGENVDVRASAPPLTASLHPRRSTI